MAEDSVTPEAVNIHLKELTPSQVETFRAKLDPILFDELYLAGLSDAGRSLFLSEPQWTLLIAGLTKLVILAFVLERGLAYLFEHPWIMALEGKIGLRPVPAVVLAISGAEKLEGSAAETFRKGAKAFIALVAAFVLCFAFHFDILVGVFPSHSHSQWGILLTAIIVAGGSQGAITLMQSVLGMRTSTRKALQEEKEANARAGKKKADADLLQSEAKKQKSMNELIGMTIHKQLADKNKSAQDLAAAIGKPEAEVEKILTGKAPVGEADKEKIANFLNLEPRQLFGK